MIRILALALAGVGAALERALAAGVPAQALYPIQRAAAYDAVFGTLYALGDPGVDGDDVLGLHEPLLGGMDGTR